jgi:hypothetical protein
LRIPSTGAQRKFIGDRVGKHYTNAVWLSRTARVASG